MKIIVISDIHVGSGPLDDCDAELEKGFVEFIVSLVRDQSPIELVINGDFLDFVQAVPWQGRELESQSVTGVPLCFTEEQSLMKLDGIIRSHGAAFGALREFINCPKNRLVIIPGNHDADLFWPAVRNRLFDTLAEHNSSQASRLRFHLAQSYAPAGFPGLWIEHGHQYDVCNRFTVGGLPRWSGGTPPILADTTGQPRLIECVGTRFLIRFLNGLDQEYPFVDNVKPFSKFLKMFLVSTVIPGFGPFRAAATYWSFVRFFARTISTTPGDLLTMDDTERGLAQEISARILQMGKADRRRLKSSLEVLGFDFSGMPIEAYLSDGNSQETFLDFASAHLDAIADIDCRDDSYLSSGETGYLSLGGDFLKNETEELKNAARSILADGHATAVVMGHTHEPIDGTNKFNYVNSGCWTRYYRETPGKKPRKSWDLLRNSAIEHFPYELSYAKAVMDPQLLLQRCVFKAGQ